METYNFEKWFKNGMAVIITSAIIGIGSSIFISWRNGISNKQELHDFISSQIDKHAVIDATFEKKADIDMVKGVQSDLQNQIIDKFNAINSKIDVVIQMLPAVQNTYNYKTQTNNK